MKILIILISIGLLASCSTFELNPYKNMNSVDKVWQVTNLVDTAQTLQLVDNPCFHESDFFTSKIIGKHPSTLGVLTWGAANSYIHAQTSNWLKEVGFPEWLTISFNTITIGIKADAIHNNYTKGIRIGEGNRSISNCTT